MKKTSTLILGLAFILALGVTSCKKDYTCVCTFTAPTPSVTLPINKSTKKDAQNTCSSAETTYKAADPGASCSLQ